MAIKLTDIKEHDTIAPESTCSRVGCIMVNDDESWTAVCPGLSHTSNGIGPFDNLPADALWMINRNYREVQALAKVNRDIQLRISTWMRIPIKDMRREWGIEDINETPSIEIIASLLDRVLKISFETVQKAGLSPRNGQLHSVIERSPSLATGIRNLVNKDMDASIPKDASVQKQFSEALSYGVSRIQNREVEDGEFLIHCRIPRLSHALRTTAQNVPAAGTWQVADLEGEPLEQKITELQALDRPVMIMATARERSGLAHEYLGAWVNRNTRATRRISYTLEETTELLPWFEFKDYSVIVGPDWRKSVTGKIIESLVDVCGGLNVATSSWSANAAAENILCGGFRRFDADKLSPECVWLSAHDRLEMIKPIESLLNCGATLVSTYAGGLVVKIAKDPEIMALAANAIWEAGMHLPIGTVQEMKAAGVEPPVDPDAWGGAPEDLILGQCLQKDLRNSMWCFDEILKYPQEHRKLAFDKLI